MPPIVPEPGRTRCLLDQPPSAIRSERASVRRPASPVEAPRRAWWQAGWQPSALAAVALAAAVGLGAWGATLNSRLSERDAVLRVIASADAIYEASGPAGSGLVIETGDQAMFMAENLADLPSGQLCEFWLIDADGNAVAVGTLTETDGLAVETLERDLEGATTFAVTVETERGDPLRGRTPLRATGPGGDGARSSRARDRDPKHHLDAFRAARDSSPTFDFVRVVAHRVACDRDCRVSPGLVLCAGN